MKTTYDFQETRWVQQGVRHIVKHIPNDDRFGVLAPEVLAAIQNGQTGTAVNAARTAADYQAMRRRTPPNDDVTTVPMAQWEFEIATSETAVAVTACCREDALHRLKPGVVYFHGGGWRWGSRAIVQNPLRLLAELSGAVVFNVEYRQAPEHLYPCATDDCWNALKYIVRHAKAFGLDSARITVSGDSAGGNIAAACSRRDRNMRTKLIRRQALIYPALVLGPTVGLEDYHFSLDDYAYDDSQAQWIKPCIQSLSLIRPGSGMYAATLQEEMTPDVSPLLDTDFSELPETLIICAEYDFLTQQCRTYAKRLAQAGVPTALMIYRGTNHGFITRTGRYPQADDAIKEIAAAVRADETA